LGSIKEFRANIFGLRRAQRFSAVAANASGGGFARGAEMGCEMPQRHSDLDDLILNCLERRTIRTCAQIGAEINAIAQEEGREGWRSDNTFKNRLDKLIERGKVKHQEQGYFIVKEWKEGQPKAFILVELAKPKKGGGNYQKMLVDEIRDGFRKGEHAGLNLISVDVVMGAEFSVIVQVYSDNLHFIGRFVKEYLLVNELVTKTRTIMVWPTEPGEAGSAR
jgi:hypothetical protein